MYPRGSNGSAQALIDARTLADELAATPTDPEGALQRYEAARLPATARVVQTNRTLPPDFLVHNVTQETQFDSRTVGIYAQDFLELTPMWKFLAGVRYDYFKAEYERIGPLDDYNRTDRVWSFRTGLLFQPSDEQSYYLAYGSSFNPSGELYALDPRGVNTPPAPLPTAEVTNSLFEPALRE